MSTSNTSKSPDASVPLNIRIEPATRNLIDRAAELLDKTRTDFMLEAPCRGSAARPDDIHGQH